jgi:hypothetical protein
VKIPNEFFTSHLEESYLMAFRQTNQIQNIGFVHNIDWTVGVGKWNRPDDVMLVQKCLNLAYGSQPDIQHEPLEMPSGQTNFLKVDGIFGVRTIAFLKHMNSGVAIVEPLTPEGIENPKNSFVSLWLSAGLNRLQRVISLQLFPGNLVLTNSFAQPVRAKARKFTQKIPH